MNYRELLTRMINFRMQIARMLGNASSMNSNLSEEELTNIGEVNDILNIDSPETAFSNESIESFETKLDSLMSKSKAFIDSKEKSSLDPNAILYNQLLSLAKLTVNKDSEIKNILDKQGFSENDPLYSIQKNKHISSQLDAIMTNYAKDATNMIANTIAMLESLEAVNSKEGKLLGISSIILSLAKLQNQFDISSKTEDDKKKNASKDYLRFKEYAWQLHQKAVEANVLMYTEIMDESLKNTVGIFDGLVKLTEAVAESIDLAGLITPNIREHIDSLDKYKGADKFRDTFDKNATDSQKAFIFSRDLDIYLEKYDLDKMPEDAKKCIENVIANQKLVKQVLSDNDASPYLSRTEFLKDPKKSIVKDIEKFKTLTKDLNIDVNLLDDLNHISQSMLIAIEDDEQRDKFQDIHYNSKLLNKSIDSDFEKFALENDNSGNFDKNFKDFSTGVMERSSKILEETNENCNLVYKSKFRDIVNNFDDVPSVQDVIKKVYGEDKFNKIMKKAGKNILIDPSKGYTQSNLDYDKLSDDSIEELAAIHHYVIFHDSLAKLKQLSEKLSSSNNLLTDDEKSEALQNLIKLSSYGDPNYKEKFNNKSDVAVYNLIKKDYEKSFPIMQFAIMSVANAETMVDNSKEHHEAINKKLNRQRTNYKQLVKEDNLESGKKEPELTKVTKSKENVKENNLDKEPDNLELTSRKRKKDN